LPDRTTSDRPVVSIRFSAAEIASRVEEMATDLSAKLASDTLVVSVLKGSFVFAADLIRALSRAGADWSMDFLTLSSYGSGTETSGNVRILLDKPAKQRTDLKADFVGFEAGDEFLVGYGLDWAHRFRGLPYIGVVEKTAG
jgi:hypoxanthine phosphoribosyltransferase